MTLKQMRQKVYQQIADYAYDNPEASFAIGEKFGFSDSHVSRIVRRVGKLSPRTPGRKPAIKENSGI